MTKSWLFIGNKLIAINSKVGSCVILVISND